MPIETYRIEIEQRSDEGLDADVYGGDDLIEESTFVAFDDYPIESPGEESNGPTYSEEITADVTTVDLQVERVDSGFAFRLLGDRDELTVVRVEDSEIGVEGAG